MKINEIINTPDGPGKIIDIENFKYARRYGVEFDNAEVKYYFKDEIEYMNKLRGG